MPNTACPVYEWRRGGQKRPVLSYGDAQVLNPWLSVLRSAEATATKLFGEFGLSPSSRTRIWASVNPPTPAKHVAPDVAESYFDDGAQDVVQ